MRVLVFVCMCVLQAVSNQLTERLSHITWQPLDDDPNSNGDIIIALRSPESDDASTFLHKQLDLLCATRLADPEGSDVHVKLVGWPITHAHMEALAGLPDAWEATLTFCDCKWPLPHRECRALATHIPTCFWKWNLGFEHPCIRRLQSIMLGVQERRAREEGADRLALTVKNRKAVRAIEKKGLGNEYVYVRVDDE